jgi:hypothetical protein
LRKLAAPLQARPPGIAATPDADFIGERSGPFDEPISSRIVTSDLVQFTLWIP